MPGVASNRPRYRFGPFELNTGEESLARNGTRLKIQDLPYRLLVMLLERPGEIVTREESGKNVGDIGAGSGWFTVRAARRVTGSGTVYAVDINPEAIHSIDQRAKKERLEHIKTILSKPDDPRVPSDSIDAVLLLKTYHEVAHPVVLLRNLRRSLRPGAKIGIIDRNGNGENHGVSKDVVVREAAQAGYELRDSQDFVKADGMDYFLIFTAKPD